MNKLLNALLIKPLAAYARASLSLWAEGFLGYVGIGKESTWGTPVAASDYFEAMSESLSETIDRFPTRNIVGGFYEPDDYAGARRSGGDLVMFGHPVSIGHLLKATMNTVSGSVVLSGSLFTSRFISTKSEFADGVPAQPYTLEMGRDVGSAHQFAGCLLNRLQLSLTPNQDLRVNANWIAKSGTLIARTTPTFPGSPVDPFGFDTASISIGGSATARVEALQVTVNNNLNGILALNASNTLARVRRTAPQEVRISGTLDFIDVAEFLDFKNQTERQFRINVTKANSFNLLIDAPRFVYTTFPVGQPGRDRLTVGFDGMAKYSTTSGVAIDFGLTTTKSNY